MTTHNFRIVLAQRRSSVRNSVRTPAPRLASAARLLSQLTGIDTNKCTVIVNESKQFKCEFRSIAQYHETMLDYGYRIYVVPKYVQRSGDNDNDVLTPTKLKRF